MDGVVGLKIRGFAGLGCLSFLLVTRIPVPFVLVKWGEERKERPRKYAVHVDIYPLAYPSIYILPLSFVSFLLAMVIRPISLLCGLCRYMRCMLDDWKNRTRTGAI